jgi:hypothetical protein
MLEDEYLPGSELPTVEAIALLVKLRMTLSCSSSVDAVASDAKGGRDIGVTSVSLQSIDRTLGSSS